MSLAPDRLSIGITRHFTAPGVHPYDEVEWERRDARISNWKDGTVAFEQLGVEFPTNWSLNATNIVAQKYFRGTLGLAKDVPVGITEIRMRFDVDTDANDEQLATLLRLTERYCVILQTLKTPPQLSASVQRVTAGSAP